MHEVILVNVAKKINKINFPIGLSVISNALFKRIGLRPTVIDLLPLPIDERIDTFKQTIASAPAIYGFGVIAGNDHIKHTEALASIIRAKSPESIIVYGGPLPSAIPERVLENCLCDYVISGEGEIAFSDLIKSIHKNDKTPNIPGVHFKHQNQIVGTKQKLIKKLDDLSELDLEPFDIEFYCSFFKEVGHAWELFASRGCWADCSFCCKFMGNGISFRSVDSVLDEIEFMMDRYSFESFYFIDENFFQVKKYFNEFIKKKNERKLTFDYNVLSRVDVMEDELLDVAVENGLKHVSMGIESFSDVALKEVGKRMTGNDIERGLTLLRKHGVRHQASIIVGFESDSVKGYEEMLDFIDRNELKKRTKVSYMTPLPGTKLMTECMAKGIIKDEWEYTCSLGDLYWERLVNLTSLPDETVDYYYNKLAEIGTPDAQSPTSNKYMHQIRKMH